MAADDSPIRGFKLLTPAEGMGTWLICRARSCPWRRQLSRELYLENLLLPAVQHRKECKGGISPSSSIRRASRIIRVELKENNAQPEA